MIQRLKNIIKKNTVLKNFIWTLKHPYTSTKKLSGKIEILFNNLDISVEQHKKKQQIDNLIVSLTSFPERIKYIEYTIFSLIKQTIRPEKIILWLSEKEFPDKENDIPESIKKYYSFDFEIQFVKDNFKPYKKLIYSLQKYPKENIVTADDDVFYKPTWLELLYNTHVLFPNDIIAHKAHKILFKGKEIDSYLKWKDNAVGASFLNFAVGYGGVLYPPNSLYSDIQNSALFLELCPYNDDIWFYAMELMAKTKVRKTKNIIDRTLSFDYHLTDEYKNVPQLFTINWIENANDQQLMAVLKYYNLYDNFFEITSENKT